MDRGLVPSADGEFDAVLLDAQDALRRGAWQQGKELFEKSLARTETPSAFDGLATCCRFLGALDESLAARERAYRLFRDAGDAVGATIAAAWLGRDSALPRAETSVARSWFAVARRQLTRTDSALARGTLRYFEGQFALLAEFDAPRAGDLGAEARAAGRECGDFDLEMQGLSLEGVAYVAEGRVAEGMALIEEATAAVLGDELSGADAAGWICCHLIYACERVSDIRRAGEWCSTMRGFCERWDMPGMFGMCRAHLGSVLMHEGRWAEAEDELVEASRLFADAAPALGYEAVVRLCALRLRQGRLDAVAELARLLEGTPLGWLCLPTRAAVALELGDLVAAGDLLDRYDRMVSARDRMARAEVLELQTRLHLARGELTDARRSAAVLGRVATDGETERLQGIAALARGGVLAASKDLDEARLELEHAVDLFARANAPFDLARARTMLGEVLTEIGEVDRAQATLSAARDALAGLGADSEARRAECALTRLRPPTANERRTLTPRELEVLRLAADGLSNGEIGDRLSLSIHTVHRHMANIRTKLGGGSKAAVVARAAREGLL
jgi:DNA-binding CsgD family transcriptional regulator/tetratricopeptide (TPR) repeat protein